MNIIAQAENKICIELTSEDMTELDITYDELDYSNIETRRVLWTLLDEARHTLGYDIRITQRMLIEAVPEKNGGCSIYFTVSDEPTGKNGKKQLVKTAGVRTVCQSDNIDSVIELSKKLFGCECVKRSALFTDGEKYRLILVPRTSFSGDMEAVISEFCDVCDSAVVPYTNEHWKKLASPDAIGVLAAAF